MSTLLNLIDEAIERLRESTKPGDIADLLSLLLEIQEGSGKRIVELRYFPAVRPGNARLFSALSTDHPGVAWQTVHAVRVFDPLGCAPASEEHYLVTDDREEAAMLLTQDGYRRLTTALERWRRAITTGSVTIPGGEAREEPCPVLVETPNRPKGIPLAEANIRVRDWLETNAKENPLAVTRDAVAAATGVSKGQVSRTPAWKAFQAYRDKLKQGSVREVPLRESMEVYIPSNCLTADQNAALAEMANNPEMVDLIEQSRLDFETENRRRLKSESSRRHKPS